MPSARSSRSVARHPPAALAALGKLLLSSHALRNDTSLDGRRRLLADFVKLLGGLPLSQGKLPSATVVAFRQMDAQAIVPKLSPRRSEILHLLLLGQSEKEVARSLTMSIHTVHVHVKLLYKKFDVNTRAELLAHCLRRDRL